MSRTPAGLARVIDGRYAIEREIGRGGMAAVYLARDNRHGGRVAIKVLSGDISSAVSAERFAREIRTTASLQHPNILPVFDSGQINGIPYYVMPYVQGETVGERLLREGPLPVGDALDIACEISDALSCAHDQGFVHRDIKPGNILLTHGHAILADFGIARAMEAVASDSELTGTGIALGTVAYMSPEQAAAGKVDGRSDIYALGCVLYEMLAGHPPFAAATPQALMARHWVDTPPSIRTVRPSVSAMVEALIMKAMAKAPADRFRDAREFRNTIRDVDTGERTAAIPVVAASVSGALVSGTATGTDPRTPISSDPESAAVDRTVRIPRSRYHIAGLAAAAVITVGALTWQFGRSGDVVLDNNRVMVYPLVVAADFKGSRSVGEDVATMIGSALDQSGPLKLIDAWPLLAPSRRQDIRTLSVDEARQLARSKNADTT